VEAVGKQAGRQSGNDRPTGLPRVQGIAKTRRHLRFIVSIGKKALVVGIGGTLPGLAES
jgi:hypothetical protein